MIADAVPIVVNGDYGADFAALSEDTLQLCADKNIFVQTLPLSEPVQAKLAMEDSESSEESVFSSSKKVRLSLTLDTPAGPLRLRNVEFVVFPYKMSEVLLSRPILQTLGFDLPSHLSAVRDKFHDMDFAHLSSSPDYQDMETASGSTVPGRLASVIMSRLQKSTDDTDTGNTVMPGASSDATFTNASELYGSEDP